MCAVDAKTTFIVHVDMDAFFAAVEQRDNPLLRGRPVVVGADPKLGRGRGVVSTASYEARKFGIHSAMPISAAFKKCPDAAFLPVDMDKYARISAQIHDIFYSFTPDIEPVSIDEAFLDITSSHHLFGSPIKTCMMLKDKIRTVTGLTASVGMAPIKMAAKIASEIGKPDGLVEVTPDGLLEFLWPLGVDKIWGLGDRAEELMAGIGVKTIGDLARTDVRKLMRIFGSNGFLYWRLANGYDERAVEPVSEMKSISNEMTFEQDTHDRVDIEKALMQLSERVSARLMGEKTKCRTITLKIRLEDFRTFTRSITIGRPTYFAEVLYKYAKSLYNNFDRHGKRVRLVGVRATGFSPFGVREDLFDEPGDSKRELVHSAVEKIRSKFGADAIYRATAGS